MKLLGLTTVYSFLRSPTVNRYSRNLSIRKMSGDQKACIPCAGMDDSHLLPMDSLPGLVRQRTPLWELSDDGKSISRNFVARNFQAALDAINAMGLIAEEQSHHPDFHLTNYRQVAVVVATHKLGGLTENDLVLAELLDDVKINYSPKWLREHPEAKETAASSE